MKKKPVMLMILDGWGIAKAGPYNAATQARTPNLTSIHADYPHTELAASGEAVGLPAGQMGNSEVGHLNIGAGRIVYQDLSLITKSIEAGDFFKNQTLLEAMHYGKKRALHLCGLLSDGGVHSHEQHLFALLQMAKEQGVEKVFIHAFLDGRDVQPQTALGYIESLEQEIKKVQLGLIATVSGRYYAMDRDKRWERVDKAYLALTEHQGECFASAAAGVEASYAAGVMDEFVVPFIVEQAEDTRVRADDSIIFFNFRPDRARELTRSLVDEEFPYFARCAEAYPVHFASMTQYDETIKVPSAYPPKRIDDTLGEVVARAGLQQLRIAETEKYAHVTFFFNGGEEVPNKNEDRVLIPSPKVATYDLQPEMSAYLVTDKLLQLLDEGKYDLIILNLANPDMVGHTGIMSAAVQAMEAVDTCVGKIFTKMQEIGGTLCITADHGNIEVMQNPANGLPSTAHTTNKVPFILVQNPSNRTLHTGKLADIAPTLLELLGITKPVLMTGTSLINK